MDKKYIEHKSKAVEVDERFEYVMAITLDSRTKFKEGIIRCVLKRTGDLLIKGFRDLSELHKTTSNSEGNFIIGEKLNIKNEVEIVNNLLEEGKRLGIINGREANQIFEDKIKYGIFSVGLFVYDYEKGKIDWVFKEPLIRDCDAGFA